MIDTSYTLCIPLTAEDVRRSSSRRADWVNRKCNAAVTRKGEAESRDGDHRLDPASGLTRASAADAALWSWYTSHLFPTRTGRLKAAKQTRYCTVEESSGKENGGAPRCVVVARCYSSRVVSSAWQPTTAVPAANRPSVAIILVTRR
jgi:hypothetical protein